MRIFATVATLAILALVVVVLVGCESPAAQRERAEAERIRAEAQAYQQRQAADAAAASERASVRQMERDAAHQRALETLPYLVLILGGLALAGFGAFIVWDLRSRQARTDPALLLYLERQRLEQAQLWRAIAHLDRRRLPVGERELIVYD